MLFFFSRALRGLSGCFRKISSSQIGFFSAFLVVWAPLRFRKPCVLPLFFIFAKKRSTSKRFQKNLVFGHLRAPAAQLIARPPPSRARNKAIRTNAARRNSTAQKLGVLMLFFRRSASTEPFRRKRAASPRIRSNAEKKIGESLVSGSARSRDNKSVISRIFVD